MQSGIEIRNIVPADFNEVFELLKQLWPGKELNKVEMEQMFLKNLDAPNQVYLGALSDRVVVGFCSLTVKNNLWQQAPLGNVDELVVHENFRNQGIGKFLLEKITEAALTRNCVQLELDSAFHRTAAHHFYENLGFAKRAFLFTKKLK